MSSIQRQTYKNALLFESSIDIIPGDDKSPLHSKNTHWIWSDRLILIEILEDEEFWNFVAFNLLMNEKRQIRFRKSSFRAQYISTFHPLNDEFGIFIEGEHNIYWINIVKINWDTNEFELIEKIERECTACWIFVDKMDPSKFALKCLRTVEGYTYQVLQFINEKVELGEIHRNLVWRDIYSSGKLIEIYPIQLRIYDEGSKNEQVIEIDSSLPENVHPFEKYEWSNNCLYMKIRFKDTRKYGIVWMDLTEKRWKLLGDFEMSLEIENLEFFNGNLIVSGNNVDRENGTHYLYEVKFFGIPMRKPNYLRKMAWLLVVQKMKNNGEKKPIQRCKRISSFEQ